MKKYVLLLFLVISGSTVTYSQIGVDVMYNLNNFKDWRFVNDNESVFSEGIGVGVDYWFKPIEQRMEMTAGLSYSNYKSEIIDISGTPSNFYYDLSEIKLNVKNNFYMFSFNDCNTCPDFNKKGEAFKKGFFLQTIIGAGYNSYDRWNSLVGENDDHKSNDITFHFGAGAGFDFRVSSRFMITPYFNYIYGLNHKYESLEDLNIDNESNRSTLQFGIRFGLTKKKNSWE